MPESGVGVDLHVVVASVLFCCALLCDAFTALGSFDHADVPSSLRATGMVATVLLASPVIKSNKTRASSPWQRPLISALLVFAAAAGEHHGLEYVRLADSAFVAVVSVGVIWLFSIESPTPPGASQPNRCKRRSDRSIRCSVDVRVLQAAAFRAGALAGGARYDRHAGSFRELDRARNDGVCAQLGHGRFRRRGRRQRWPHGGLHSAAARKRAQRDNS